MEKEYKVKSALKNAIEKITGKDYGSEMNEKEQEEAANALVEYRENCEKYAKGFEQAFDKIKELQARLEQAEAAARDAQATTSGYVEKVRELNAELVKKNEEIKTLKENNPAYNLLHRLKQAVIDLISFK